MSDEPDKKHLINDVLSEMGLPPLAPDRKVVLKYLPKVMTPPPGMPIRTRADD